MAPQLITNKKAHPRSAIPLGVRQSMTSIPTSPVAVTAGYQTIRSPRIGFLLHNVRAWDRGLRLLQVFSCSGQDQFSVLHSAHRQHVIGEMFDLSTSTFHDDHL